MTPSEQPPPPPPSPLHRGRRETTVTRHPANIHVYEVTQEQLESIANAGHTVALGLAFACLGGVVTLVVALLTSSLSETRLAVVSVTTVGLFLVMVVSGVFAYRKGNQHNQTLRRILGDQ